MQTSDQAAYQFQERLKILNEVTIELSKAPTFDDLCRQAVELGRSRLGFDRISIWFWSNDHQHMLGAFGTDENGQTRDERGARVAVDGDPLVKQARDEHLGVTYADSINLYNHKGEVVGQGWNAMAVLGDADQAIGWLSADNYLHRRPLTPADVETLALYGSALGNLCARKRAEDALRESEEIARAFQGRLKALNEVTLELSKAATFDELCRQAVALGRAGLDFDRLSVWFRLDEQTMGGSFGTDEDGSIRDERDVRLSTDADFLLQKALAGQHSLVYDADMPLYNHHSEVVGRGWHAMAALKDGDQAIGWITADNYFRGRPLTNSDLEVLALYGSTLGHLCARKRAEEALRASEEASRKFQARLKALNEVNIELAKAATFDDLCRSAVELGRAKLGFDRLGLWFWSADGGDVVGSFGTDEQGNTRDERWRRRPSWDADLEIHAAQEQVLLALGQDVPLRNEAGEFVGQGWNAMATLWDGDRAIGWLAADNLIHQRPLDITDLEILKLYGLALGNLCTRLRAEDALRSERNLLRVIIDTAPEAIYVKDTQSRFILANQVTWKGAPALNSEAELLGKTDFDFLPRELAERFRADEETLFATGSAIVHQEEQGFDSQKNPIFLLTSKIPLRDYQGSITGLVGVSRDITEDKRIKQALQASEEAARAFQERLKVLYEISLDLARIPTFDDLCRAAVDLGRSRLGFDRLGIWLLDEDPAFMVGSFGTDEHGMIRDERGNRLPISTQDKSVLQALSEQSGRVFVDKAPIYNNQAEVISFGQTAMAMLSDGHTVIGTISTDNLIQRRPITEQDLEVLVLYGATLGYLCSRKRAEEALLKERNLLRTIIDILPDRIYVKDRQSRVMLVNKASWLGTPGVRNENDMIGMTGLESLPEDITRQILADEQGLFATGEPILNREEPVRYPDQSPIYFLSTKVPLRDAQGDIVGLVGFSRDITDQKQAEQQRLELALQKERVDLLTEFIGNMSHDLKTPLSVIKTSLYLLEHLDDPARQEAKIKVIKDQTLRLERLIQDVITMSRLDHGAQPAFEPVDFNRVVHDVVAKLQPTAERKRLKIALRLNTGLPPILANENELWRLVANLYENALHYTPEAGAVTLSTDFADHHIIAEIRDTGIGIGAADMPNIFDRFYRADPARSIERGGTGLGLAIVKRIVELHQGAIEVESQEGQGSIFRVSFPIP